MLGIYSDFVYSLVRQHNGNADKMEQKSESSKETVEALHRELTQKMDEIPSEKEMKIDRMDLLHKYNDIKDAAQTVIGAIANVRGVTIKSLHNELNLPLDS